MNFCSYVHSTGLILVLQGLLTTTRQKPHNYTVSPSPQTLPPVTF